MINWNAFEKMRIDLAKPLLIIRGKKGFLSGPYLNPMTCSRKTKEACAIVPVVTNYHEMVDAKIIDVSDTAKALGVKVGMTGAEALERFR